MRDPMTPDARAAMRARVFMIFGALSVIVRSKEHAVMRMTEVDDFGALPDYERDALDDDLRHTLRFAEGLLHAAIELSEDEEHPGEDPGEEREPAPPAGPTEGPTERRRRGKPRRRARVVSLVTSTPQATTKDQQAGS